MTKTNKPIFIDFLTTKVEQRTKDGKIDILTVVKMLNEQGLRNGLTKKQINSNVEAQEAQEGTAEILVKTEMTNWSFFNCLSKRFYLF